MDCKVRKTNLTISLAGAVALLATAALAQDQIAHPTLAPGIAKQPAYIKPQGQYVVTNGTPLYKQPYWTPGSETGVELKRGDRPDVIAETDEGLWLLIGKNGQGIGYAPRSLMCPVKLCPSVKS